jgi:hypothetical protein
VTYGLLASCMEIGRLPGERPNWPVSNNLPRVRGRRILVTGTYKGERPTLASRPFWVALTPTLRHWREGVTMKVTATPGTATALYHAKQGNEIGGGK